MLALRVMLKRLVALVDRRRRDAALDEEIQTHLQLLADEYVGRGLSADDARLAARREFGGVDQVKEAYRDRRSLPLVEQMMHDARYALRQLRRNPSFAATAVLVLGLGVGVSAAIFEVVDTVLVRPVTYPAADRLVVVHEGTPTGREAPVNAMHYLAWRDAARSLDALALVDAVALNLGGGSGEPERLIGGRASTSLFSMIGARVQLGRLFTADEDRVGHDHVIVLGDALWRRRFGADPTIVGRTIALSGEPYEVIGVLTRDFHFPSYEQLFALPAPIPKPEFWKPFGLRDDERNPVGRFNYVCLARLAPGVTLADASRELNRVEADLGASLPQRLDLHAVVKPLQTQIVARSRAGITLLFAAVAVVWLVGCLNLMNLWLVKVLGRRHELAVRQALGASRARLLRQIAVEAGTIASLGACVAIPAAFVALRAILVLAPASMPRLDEVAFSGRVLAYIAALTGVSATLVALAPAREATRGGGTLTVRAGTTGSRDVGRLRSAIVAAEIALTVVCLIVAGLQIKSLMNLLAVDRGFTSGRVALVELNVSGVRYDSPEARAAFLRAVEARAAAVPGVDAVGMSNKPPLTGIGQNSAITLDGTTVAPLARPVADVRPVNPDYFATWGIPLVAGRLFSQTDRTRPVAVVSEFTAAHVWPNRNPIGQRFRFGLNPASPELEVIGVVGDVRGIALESDPSYAAYVPYWQRDSQIVSIAVRSGVAPASVGPALRQAIRSIDPELPIAAVRTMDDVVDDATAARRFQLNLVVGLAATALVLASLGIFGVLSYAVVQRRGEIGIRLALGGAPAAIRRLIVKSAMRVALAGLIVGVPIGIAVGYAMRSMLFGLAPADAATVAAVSALILAVAGAAAYVPAVRASGVDPIVVLRSE